MRIPVTAVERDGLDLEPNPLQEADVILPAPEVKLAPEREP